MCYSKHLYKISSQSLLVTNYRKKVSIKYDNLLPFWLKSRLPTQDRRNILPKIKQLFSEQTNLMKNRSRSNEHDLINQKKYNDKLDLLFDVSPTNADQIIKNEEDRQFLRLQKESRTGCIGPVDNKLDGQEKRSAERRKRLKTRLELTAAASTASQSVATDKVTVEDHSSASPSADEEEDNIDEYVTTRARVNRQQCKRRKLRDIVSEKVSAVLDRTNTSIRTSTMILASVVNEVGCSTSSTVLSRSTVHRQRQHHRRETAEQIKKNCKPSKCVVHWDGKLLPDMTGVDTNKVDRLLVLVSSLADGETKLLGVPKLLSGSGQAAADAVIQLLKSWQFDTVLIGMCFDTTA